MLDRLKQDHANIATVLSILKRKCNKLARGEYVNYNVLRDIIEYMQTYTDHSHHPIEDIVYQYYVDKHDSNQPTADRLHKEHNELIEATADLMAILNSILNDIIIEKSELMKQLTFYVEKQNQHMQFENKIVFPKLDTEMDDGDWIKIRILVKDRLVDDPVFSENADTFTELQEYIAEMESG